MLDVRSGSDSGLFGLREGDGWRGLQRGFPCGDCNKVGNYKKSPYLFDQEVADWTFGSQEEQGVMKVRSESPFISRRVRL